MPPNTAVTWPASMLELLILLSSTVLQTKSPCQESEPKFGAERLDGFFRLFS